MSLLGVVLVAANLAADELETIDGARFTGKLEGISGSGEVTGAGIPAGARLDSLRSIARDVKVAPVKPKFILETHGDGRLLVNSVSLSNDRFTVALAGGKEMELPLDAVRCVRLEPDLSMASFKEALSHPAAILTASSLRSTNRSTSSKG